LLSPIARLPRWSSMTTEPSLLHVTEQATGELPPRAATLHVTLTASRLFSGRAALTKSEELRRLADALIERGIPETALSLEGATIDVSTGLFSRSSSVTYRVRIRISDLDTIAGALETVAEAKQATLSHIEWDHGTGSDDLVAECAERAAARARRIAAALGATLGDVHEVREEQILERPPEAAAMFGVRAAAMDSHVMTMKRRKSIGDELAGLDLAPTKPIAVRVSVAYRLSSGSRPAP
jgi:uncharacterized protein YggE